MDPVEFRLKNIMKTGDVTCNDFNMSSLGMKECLEAVRDGSGWTEKKGKLPKGKGIGVACGFFVSGAGYPDLSVGNIPLDGDDQALGRRGNGEPLHGGGRDRPGIGYDPFPDSRRSAWGCVRRREGTFGRHGFRGRSRRVFVAADPYVRPRCQSRGGRCEKAGPRGPFRGIECARAAKWTLRRASSFRKTRARFFRSTIGIRRKSIAAGRITPARSPHIQGSGAACVP